MNLRVVGGGFSHDIEKVAEAGQNHNARIKVTSQLAS